MFTMLRFKTAAIANYRPEFKETTMRSQYFYQLHQLFELPVNRPTNLIV